MKIAAGKNRFDILWKNKEVTWDQFLNKLKKPIVTVETAQQYLSYTKTEQDRIKDVGGYIGGSVTGGQRKLKSITTREMFTLDADYANDNIMQEFTTAWPCCCAAHGTRKDRPGNRRVRIVGPFSRPCTPEESEAVSRMLTSKVGIDMFDDTTYQPHRLMYWPSVSCDQSYYFEDHDGEALDVDKVLALYGPNDAWRDTANWPESSRVTTRRVKEAKNQGDPLAKSGVIGAFCRTYSIQEAIDTFLEGIYEPTANEDRYTYTEGSTFGGAILYDDVFLYSNHATDPISGMLCNAFDLVRMHKFGEDNTDKGHEKSMSAMQAWCLTIKKVKQTLGEERLTAAQEDFADVKIIDNNWLQKIEYNNLGMPKPTPRNIRLILTNDEKLKGVLQYDEFRACTTVVRDLPWRSIKSEKCWTDEDDACLRNYIQTTHGIKGKDIIYDAVSEIVVKSAVHPVRDFLSSLAWDCIDRLDTVFIDYLGAEDTPYTRQVTRKMLMAAAKRIFEPGCKFDNMLVLVGTQGLGKSTLLRKLANGWFTDSVKDMRGKAAYEAIQGSWIIEFGELIGLKKSEVEEVKSFLSAQSDTFRPSYGRRVKMFQRQCVFFGSTNESDFLQDDTGNRRFWPLPITGSKKNINNISDYEINQIWAEAVECVRSGESLELDSHIAKMAQEMQDSHTYQSEKTGMVLNYVDTPVPTNWDSMELMARREYLTGGLGSALVPGELTFKRNKICIMEIWRECFNGDPKNLTRQTSFEIAGILKKSKSWVSNKKTMRFSMYGSQKGFIRIV